VPIEFIAPGGLIWQCFYQLDKMPPSIGGGFNGNWRLAGPASNQTLQHSTPTLTIDPRKRRWLKLFYEDRFVLVADGLLPSLIGNRATSFHEILPQTSTTILIKLSVRLCRPKSIANFVTAITAARPTLSYMIR
jgi:hypothetical protein